MCAHSTKSRLQCCQLRQPNVRKEKAKWRTSSFAIYAIKLRRQVPYAVHSVRRRRAQAWLSSGKMWNRFTNSNVWTHDETARRDGASIMERSIYCLTCKAVARWYNYFARHSFVDAIGYTRVLGILSLTNQYDEDQLKTSVLFSEQLVTIPSPLTAINPYGTFRCCERILLQTAPRDDSTIMTSYWSKHRTSFPRAHVRSIVALRS